MSQSSEKQDVSKNSHGIGSYIIWFTILGGFVFFCSMMIHWGITNPYEPGPMVIGTVIGFSEGIRGRSSINVKLDEGPVVIVGGRGNSSLPFLMGRRIQLQELTSGNRKGYRFIGYLEPEPDHGVPPVSSFHQERP